MNHMTLPLSDSRADLATVGGKGMSLAKMIQAGLPVPGGFHVTTDAYRAFVAENGIQQLIIDTVREVDVQSTDSLEAASKEIARAFAAGTTPAPIAQAVADAYRTLNDAPVAVRSSATAEDLPGASFAGQQETYLNICGVDAVLDAVKKCWASLWTARAIAYRIKNNIDQETVALAVVVQELVFADAAGILFTANPVNGKRDEMLINAAWGLGEAVVSGAVTPDTLTVRKEPFRIVHRQTAEKQVMTVRTPDGTEEQPVPTDRKRKPVLRYTQAKELAQLAGKIEQFYGMPMDVEWALAGGTFAIVQARPITAMPPEWIVPAKGAVYARGSLAEHIPSPVTPLFATLGLEIANQATSKMWERMLGSSWQTLMVDEGFYVPLNGYVFGGVNMRGKELWNLTKMSIKQMGPMFRGSVARWKAARKDLEAVVSAWEPKDVTEMRPSELLEGIRKLFGAACVYFTNIQTVLPAASSSEVMFTNLYNKLIRRKGDPEATAFLLGFETASLRSEKSLYDIAAWLKTSPALAAYVQDTATETLVADLKRGMPPQGLNEADWQAWQERFQGHLKAFGRAAYEFDFANPTPGEMPGPLVDAIKGFLSGKASDPHERQREAVQKREQATQAVLNRTGWPRKGWFLKLLRWTQDTGPMREDSIFDMGMGHPTIRRMFGELGRRLAAGGAIEEAEEIYWLEQVELEELISKLDDGQPLPDLSDRIPARKEEWQAQLKITPPVMLPERSGWSRFIHGGDAERKDGKIVLKGVGTSGGTITARACVLFGPEDFGKMQPGDVLVAVTTTPAWTPLFATASAVVTDIGGPLSHSSIVAREYGIPAVMAARTATRQIETGQRITVDGSAGTVTLE